MAPQWPPAGSCKLACGQLRPVGPAVDWGGIQQSPLMMEWRQLRKKGEIFNCVKGRPQVCDWKGAAGGGWWMAASKRAGEAEQARNGHGERKRRAPRSRRPKAWV